MIMKVIFPRNYEKIDDKFLKKIVDDNYKRIYIGGEFCFRLFPDFNKIQQLIKIVLENGLDYSIITPPLFQDDYLKFIKKIDRLIECYGQIEVIVNDMGLLYYLRNKKIDRVAGRAISHLGESEGGRVFLKSMGIGLIESDDLYSLNGKDFGISLYYPYRFMQTTRNCIISSLHGKCRKQCLYDNFYIKNSMMREKVIYLGNSSYIEYDKIFNKKVERKVTEILY